MPRITRENPENAMTTTRFKTPQASRATAVSVSGPGTSAPRTVAPGTAVRLTARYATVLRIGEGQAWVTLGTGEITHGDVFLCAGQTLPPAAGQQVVIEPLTRCRVQYHWTRQKDGCGGVATSWWQRAALGNPRHAPDGLGGACSA